MSHSGMQPHKILQMFFHPHQDLNYINYRLENVKMLAVKLSLGMKMLKTSSQSNNHSAKRTSE